MRSHHRKKKRGRQDLDSPKILIKNILRTIRRAYSSVKDIINGLFLGCIQNKAILISMSVGRHDRVVLKYWTFFQRKDGEDNYDIQKRKVFNCSLLGGLSQNKYC